MTVALPYAGTSGWSGTDTSRERAEEADSTGATASRQRELRQIGKDLGTYGITVTELKQREGWAHHGTASGTLTTLHMVGDFVRLSQKRGRCKVYVHADHVAGRETEPFAPSKAKVAAEQALEMSQVLAESLAEVAPDHDALQVYRLLYPGRLP